MNAQLPIVQGQSLTVSQDTAALVRELALDHLRLRLRPLNRALRELAQARADRTGLLHQPAEDRPSITNQHMLQLFEEIEAVTDGHPPSTTSLAPNSSERAQEAELRRAADELGTILPIVAMRRALGLSEFEVGAVVTCAAPQLRLSYHRIFAFVHDDLNRLAPSTELLLMLEGRELARQLRQRAALAPHGKLLRLGLLHSQGEPANELQREFALAPGVLADLACANTDWAHAYSDRDLVEASQPFDLALFPDWTELGAIAELLQASAPCCVGIWGRTANGGLDAAIALAKSMDRPLRRLPGGTVSEERLLQVLDTAQALDAIVLIDADALPELGTDTAAARQSLATLAGTRARDVIVIGVQPWHPIELLQGRVLAELHLTAPDHEQRQSWWSANEPEIDPETRAALAARYRFSPHQIAAATASVRLHDPDAAPAELATALTAACRAVSMQRAAEFAQVTVPKRRPDQLILPEMLHRRVLEVAEFFRHQSQVDDGWGFGRLLSGAGMKVLMTGDSGTGKTAAAEVIAGKVASDQLLLKVNLAGVVSKWVGETERNLDAVFTHAEESHAALFFDEADALFAKRGEVERGADRYANLEVGFLLQRLEEFGGLAILASNHKDQIDEAFMRRFQVILHFPRPGVEERRKLWALALPPEAPLDKSVNLTAFDALDLTGAGIVNAARLAGMLAASSGAEAIGMEHLVAAVVRQFQHEARLLTPSQLGEFAHLATSSA